MNKKPGARAIPKDKDETVFSKAIQILLSVGVAMIVFFVLTLVFALYSASQDDPRRYRLVLGIAAAVLASLAGGFMMARVFSGSIAMCVLSGALYTLMFLILRLIFAASEPFGVLCVLLFYPGLIGASLIGSIIGRYRPDPAKSRKKRIKKFTD